MVVRLLVSSAVGLYHCIAMLTAQIPLVLFFGVVKRSHGVFGPRLFEGPESVAATALQNCGSVTRLGWNVAPACIASNHEWLEARDRASDDTVI